MKDTSPRIRKFLAILAVVIGLFMVVVAPILVQVSLDRIIAALMEVAKERPQYSSGITLFEFFYPLWRAFNFIAGAALIVIAPAIYKGKEWTYHVALLAYAMPSMGGMFMFLPYVSWVPGFPVPMVMMWVGLVGFWGTLWLRQAERTQKLAEFLVYTFVGMLATHSFILNIGALRMLMTRPGQPLFNGVEWWILTMVGDIDLLACAMLIISLPLLALRKSAGWWLAVISSVAILLIDAPTQLIRTATLDYLWGTLLAIGTLFFLLFPLFRQRLVAESQIVNASG